MLGDELLVVEFSDLLLLVELDTLVGVPVLTVHLREESPLLLAWFWLGQLPSLVQIEWESQKLLAVGGLQLLPVHMVHNFLVSLKVLVQFL